MAKNSVDSKVNLVTLTLVRREGTLIEAGDKVIIFKHKKPGGQRLIQQGYKRENVASYGDDHIVALLHDKVPRVVFREMQGNVTVDKNGFYNIDGVCVNPEFAQIAAEFAPDKSAAPKKAKVGTKKKAK